MKTHSLKFAVLSACAMSYGMTLNKYIHQYPIRLQYNPGEESVYSKGNSGVRNAQRAAKSIRNVRARSSK